MSTTSTEEQLRQAQGQPETDSRKEQILRAAANLYHVKGYGQSSMRDLADAVGISIAGLYYYFSSKDDIVYAILEGAVDDLLANLQAARDSSNEPEQRVLAMLLANIPLVVNKRAEFRIMLDMLDRLPPDRQAVIRKKQREAVLIMRTELQQLQAKGQIDSDLDLNALTLLLNGMINWLYFWYKPNGRLNLNELAELMARIFFHGVEKRPK